MGADFRRLSSSAASVFSLADRITELPLSSVVESGPLDRLTDTRYAQPAVVATSLAALIAFREQADEAGLPPPRFVAGHSVGELAAGLRERDVLVNPPRANSRTVRFVTHDGITAADIDEALAAAAEVLAGATQERVRDEAAVS